MKPVALPVLLLLAWGTLCPASADGQVVVLLSHEAEYYRACLEGLEDELGGGKSALRASSWVLSEAKGDELLEKVIGEQQPAVVVTLGTEATKWAVAHCRDFSICFAMVPSKTTLGFTEEGSRWPVNLSGVVLQVPLERQIELLRRVLPEAGRIGIAYSEVNEGEVSRLQALLKQQGLGFVPSRISSAKDLSAGLVSLKGAVDVLFALPDPLVYNGVSAKYVLLFSLQHRIPLVAFSSSYVKGGALMGFYADPKDVGVQCGKVVKRILTGRPPTADPIEFPGKIRLGWNRKVSERLGLPAADEAVVPADVVLEQY